MKTFAGVAAAAMLAWSVSAATLALADDIDLSTWTCKRLQSASKDDIGIILAWLDGYYKDEDDPPVIDTTKFVDNAKKLGEYCAAHPDIGLITAMDKLFQKECLRAAPTINVHATAHQQSASLCGQRLGVPESNLLC
jgi:acid stress chaperone HdeB